MKQLFALMFIGLSSCFLSFLLSCQQEKDPFEVAVRTSVARQMEQYPKSTLKDLYKSFFQDVFGPGHIISDPAAADNYLRNEIDSYTEISGEVAEPLGWRKNYLRVNLSVIKNGQVPYDTYFDVFVHSVNGVQPMSIDEWKVEWGSIESIIHAMNLNLPDYAADKQEIEAQLNQGNYVGHHSKAYEEAYDPHYRIMSTQIYEKEILPLLEVGN